MVQEAVDQHRIKMADLATILQRIISNPTIIADLDFDRKLAEVQDRVDQLWVDAKMQSGGDKSISIQLEELKNRLKVCDLPFFLLTWFSSFDIRYLKFTNTNKLLQQV